MKLPRNFYFLPFSFCILPVAIYAQTIHQTLDAELKSAYIRPSVIDNNTDLSDKENAVVVSQTKNIYSFKASTYTLTLTKKPFNLQFKNLNNGETWAIDTVLFVSQNGESEKITDLKNILQMGNFLVLVSENKGIELKLEAKNKGSLKLSINKNDSARSGKLHVAFKGGGNFFGGGERFMGSRLNGHVFSNMPSDHAWLIGNLERKVCPDFNLKLDEPTYIPIPFIISAEGNGLYIDQAHTTRINLQNADRGSFSVDVDGNGMDMYLFAEKTPKKVLTNYTALVGRTLLPPKWAFGVWLTLVEGRDSIINKANYLKKIGMPLDAVWMFDFDDPKTNTGWCYWTKGYHGNLRELTDTIHNLGFKTLTYLRTFMNKDLFWYNLPNPYYVEALKNNLILEPKIPIDGKRFDSFNSDSQVNFYNPGSINFWRNTLKEILVTENFDGWMEDFGDIHNLFDREKCQYTPLDFKRTNLLANDELANLYPMVYHKITRELAQEIKPDAAAFCRSGSAGSAEYTQIVWGGDQVASWDKNFGYPSLISAALSSGWSGYGIWTADIASLSPSRELWMRWVQFGAFTALMRDHPWDFTQKSNIGIWTDTAAMNYFKKYAVIHSALKDYLYEFGRIAHETGIPIMRHLALEFPMDTACYNIEYEYMLGDKILVAPVIEEGATTQSVYLPAGKWKYYWSEKIYSGNARIVVDAPIDQIPFFAKQEGDLNLLKGIK